VVEWKRVLVRIGEGPFLCGFLGKFREMRLQLHMKVTLSSVYYYACLIDLCGLDGSAKMRACGV